MLDNALIALLITIINAGLTLRGINGVQVVQSYQPTQQGILETPMLLISKVNDHPYGFTERTDVWDSVSGSIIHTESQLYETYYQIGSLFPQNPSVNTLTASDLLNAARQVLQSDDCIYSFLQSGVQVLKVDTIRNPYFRDDQDLFEMSSSFDIVLTHRQTFSNDGNVVSLINEGIYPV